jgi:hypothetical protein
VTFKTNVFAAARLKFDGNHPRDVLGRVKLGVSTLYKCPIISSEHEKKTGEKKS